MTISSGMNIALAGLNNGLREMMTYAGKIASQDTLETGGEVSLNEALVGLKQSRLQVSASIKVVETFDEVMGTLLDEKV